MDNLPADLEFSQLNIKKEPADSPVGHYQQPPEEALLAPKLELSDSIQTLIQEAMIPPTGERQDLITQVVETVTEAHLNTCNYTSDKVAEGMAKYKRIQAKLAEVSWLTFLC